MDASNQGGVGTPALVVADHYQIRYRRHGTGSPVILLRPPELATSTDAELLDGLAARFRVLVPVPAEGARVADGPDDTLRWLTAFVEGLGVMDGAIVAAGRYRYAAMEVADALPDQLARVVLLGASDTDRNGSWPRFLTVAADPGQARSALPRIVSFLLSEGGARSP